MKRCIGAVLLMGIGWSTGAAAVNVKHLWEPQTKPKHPSIRSLWKKSRSVSPHSSTLVRIQDSRTTLEQTQTQQTQANQKLERIARTIRQAELENIAISKVLDRLEKAYKKSETVYQFAKTAIDQYGGKIHQLDQTIKGRHTAFIHLLTDQFALVAALQALDRPTIPSVVAQEAYTIYAQKNNQELSHLKQQINGSKQAKAQLLARQSVIKKSIRNIAAKRERYRQKKKEQALLLARLAKKEAEYRAQIKTIMARQDALRQTLAKLNILHKKEVAAAARTKQARKAELRRKTAALERMRREQARKMQQAKAEGRQVTYITPRIAATPATGNVKQYGSSYQNSNVQAYRGARTIAPLAHARVVKKFGTYIDPIYKIKIFNDNVVLKASKSNAKVRNVLNGKVVYIGQNSMLGKVIIVEHGHRLHTIYAALDRISPLLHTGSRVKKGVIIGRVKHKLVFQATQNSKYINPLRLIRL